jgi:hypothetical protein
MTGCGTAYLMGANNQSGYGAGGFDSDPVIWAIRGQSMTFEQFIDTLYPVDCSEKTMMILKLKGDVNDRSDK